MERSKMIGSFGYGLGIVTAALLLAAPTVQARPVVSQDSIEIVGGDAVDASDAIATSTVGLTDGQSLCTGTLIAPDMVITAAHCVDGVDLSAERVVFNTHMLTAKAKKAKVLGAVMNPGWRGEASTGVDEHDIAVIRFSGALPAGYAPAQILTDTSSLSKGDSVILAGYGITDAEANTGYGILRKTTVRIENPNLGQTEIEFDQTSGHGACHGDSGGPALIQKNGQLYLLGLTNRGYPDDAPDDCRQYSVYTKISAYLDWIQATESQLRAQ